MFAYFLKLLVRLLRNALDYVQSPRRGRKWARKTLVVGPSQPVDGDSVASTKALLNTLRSQGLEAFTLPTLAMYKQIAWVLDRDDFHPSVKELMNADFVTEDLQASYDALLKSWQPDEIVLLDGPVNKLGFDSRGVEVFNIDHHTAAGTQDDESAYIKRAPSAGCLLIDRYHIYDPILAVSILTDTFWLRQNDPASATHYLDLLVDHGMTNEQLAEIQRRLKIQKDPVILKAIAEAEMRITGDTIFMVLKTADKEIHRGVMSECGYFSRHICVIRNDGYASLRTDDPNIDLRPLARKFSGGGHAAIAAVVLREFAAPDNVMKEQKKQAVERLYQAFLEVVAPQGKGSAGKT